MSTKQPRRWVRFSQVAVGAKCWVRNTAGQTWQYTKSGERTVTRVLRREDGKVVKRTFNLYECLRGDDDVQVEAGPLK